MEIFFIDIRFKGLVIALFTAKTQRTQSDDSSTLQCDRAYYFILPILSIPVKYFCFFYYLYGFLRGLGVFAVKHLFAITGFKAE
jgi:hypothetical protein